MAQQPILSISQEQRQIQTLAPQLRQSLELLQLPTLELRALIQQELLQNPTLEEKTADAQAISLEEGSGAIDDTKELSFKDEFEVLARMDEEWHDYFMQEQEFAAPDPDYERKRDFLINDAVQESLQEHLRHQLALAAPDEETLRLGELLIGNINDDGWLTQPLEEIAPAAGCEISRLEDVLHLIQDFDPIGVGARNLQECLLLQLERIGHGEKLAAEIVKNHLELLGQHNFMEIAKRLNTPVAEVHRAARLIATLDPKPGRAYAVGVASYIVPDVVVEKVNQEYVVVLNNDQLPRLRISRQYRQMLAQGETDTEVRAYLRDRLRASVFLIKSIAQRQQTLYRVAREIVRIQRDFLEHGIAHLKPLVMADVAQALKLHETTISRCVANKYMQTPCGLFEMKFFFTPGLKTASGEAISNKTVQDIIQGLINAEDPARPLSDQELQQRLKEQGVQVARRTIAKYRLLLKIPPSHLRKVK